MSNDTITRPLPVNHTVAEQFGPEQGTGTLRFKRDKLEVGTTHFQVFSPDDGRPQHSDMATWGTKIESITEYRASDDGQTCVTLNLETHRGGTVQVALWGVTLDTLASAVEAGHRSTAAGVLREGRQ